MKRVYLGMPVSNITAFCNRAGVHHNHILRVSDAPQTVRDDEDSRAGCRITQGGLHLNNKWFRTFIGLFLESALWIRKVTSGA